ncbi:hypothetical protein [Amycolatopsis sp. NPDC004169]|uniref:hypothetical protein n=1 Tax=Amycolatopsis sp. NPDC004169 TaxID=3154453 RepID=UPI0033A0F331
MIVEGDGTQVIDEQAVNVVVDPAVVDLPADVARLRDEVAARQGESARAGAHAHWNGPTCAVSGFSVHRIGVDEAPGVRLRVRSTDYFTFLATQQPDRERSEARRWGLEELGLERTEYHLELLAFDIDRRTSQWGWRTRDVIRSAAATGAGEPGAESS